eukprot:5459104-Amphidinium_carterae.1
MFLESSTDPLLKKREKETERSNTLKVSVFPVPSSSAILLFFGVSSPLILLWPKTVVNYLVEWGDGKTAVLYWTLGMIVFVHDYSTSGRHPLHARREKLAEVPLVTEVYEVIVQLCLDTDQIPNVLTLHLYETLWTDCGFLWMSLRRHCSSWSDESSNTLPTLRIAHYYGLQLQ